MNATFEFFKRWFIILWVSAKRLYLNNFSYQASALAFVTILSIAPILSIFLYAASFFPSFSIVIQAIDQYLYANLVPASNATIRTYLEQFTTQTIQIPAFSILFSIVNGFLILLTIESAFNDIWDVTHKPRKFDRLLITAVVLLLVPIFIGITTLLSATVMSVSWFDKYQYILVDAFNMIINCSVITILYVSIPNIKISWHEGLIGGVIAALLFEWAKKGFLLYILFFSNYEVIYGALAAIPIFLIWLYVSWCIFLYGSIVLQCRRTFYHQPTVIKEKNTNL